MSQETAKPVDEQASLPRPSRRRLWILTLGGAALAAVLAYYGWRWRQTPVPPDVPLQDVDPALAERITSAQQKVRAEPNSAAAWGQLGKLLLNSHFDDQAVACFIQAERLDPLEPRWPYFRADALLRHDPEPALAPLRRAVELCEQREPTNTAVRLRLAETLLALDLSDEAENQLNLVLEMEPNSARAHWDLGLLAYQRADWENSRRHLERCLDNPMTRRRACTKLAAIYQRQNDARTAAEFNAKAAAAPADLSWDDPFVREYQRQAQVGNARFQAVESLQAAGRYQEAVRILRELAEENPDFRVYFALGKNLLALGDYREAETALRTALQKAPDKAQAYYYLSKLFWLEAEQQRQQGGEQAKTAELLRSAIEFAHEAIDRKPDHAFAYLYLGLALRQRGEQKQGLAALRTAVQLSPDSVDLHLRLAEALAADSNMDEAKAQLQSALQVARPDDPRPRAALDKLTAQDKKAN